ncbi:hypothetical protein CHU_1488 [Cytophaga hutchinsonii ATCC 33406]|uniref:Uncharacterized protein n=1 Tax=Cytophaga hutchinsonii (strain ATCC 33406 / DSM 1761 / CIP 103989 / NBRC 15051 / NCIMB 9469 / D465) TaxID=269798 RepID=A0A6N4SR51_CYTH3|nr:hypothetical protein CHU_1488 [Cytophaga hutchinsonii ATCC 33406]
MCATALPFNSIKGIEDSLTECSIKQRITAQCKGFDKYQSESKQQLCIDKTTKHVRHKRLLL